MGKTPQTIQATGKRRVFIQLVSALGIIGIITLAAELVVAEDDLRMLVTNALAEESKLLDDIGERLAKNKLKPAEKLSLFGKKGASLGKVKQEEMLAEMREKAMSGEISFRRLLPANVGESGCLPSEGKEAANVQVRQVVRKDAFLGCHLTDIPISTAPSRGTTSGKAASQNRAGGSVLGIGNIPVLFVGIPDADNLTDGKHIKIRQPLIVTGRFTYNTVAAGMKTTFVVEPLSACIRKLATEK